MTVGAILFGAGFTLAACLGLGGALLRLCRARLSRTEWRLIGFACGAAMLSLAIFCLAAVGWARTAAFAVVGAGSIAAGLAAGRPEHAPDCAKLPRPWLLLFLAVLVPFGVLYLAQAIGPEYSPDGSRYHLGYVARYFAQGGFGTVRSSLFANLSQGVEMLFLFAFAFGRHPAAATVHFGFLTALVLGMAAYGRRSGAPVAGVFGAGLVWASPAFGFDGTAAYNDVAAGCVVFFLFYLLEVWDEAREAALLIPAGLLAGFAYAIKYTMFAAVLYAAAFVWWRSRRLRPAALVAAMAAVMIAPWMAKDWVTVGNPVSPFFNRWFPNPYTNTAFEREYVRTNGIHRDGFRFAGAATEMTLRGGLSRTLLGPEFLLAPVALVSLRRARGRRLLAAGAVFGAAWFWNVDTRMLIPAAVFVALAMGTALEGTRAAAAVVLAAQAVLCWPTVAARYADPLAARVRHFRPREALRMVPEEATLEYRLPGYRMARLIDRRVPADGRVLALAEPPLAYTSREVWVWWEASANEAARDVLLMPIRPETQPLWKLEFQFRRQRLVGVRVIQTARDAGAQWSIGEVHAGGGGRARASENPWDAAWATDGNPVTRWRSLAPLAPGMRFDIEFGAEREIDSVALDCAHDQWGARVRLEGETSPGRWVQLAAATRPSENPPLGDLRRAAVLELRRRGITHVLIGDADFGAADFRERAEAWGIAPAAEADGQRLYELR